MPFEGLIFISHAHADKPFVEPIAVALAQEFGQDHVFYDSWSIHPGDGIIDRINAALGNTVFFLFFVSDASLKSGIAGLEWRNALFGAAKGRIRFIPIRLDRSHMPPILVETRYVDLYEQGIIRALQEIKDVIEGREPPLGQFNSAFENVAVYAGSQGRNLIVEWRAVRLVEPHTRLFALFENTQGEIDLDAPGEVFHTGFFANLASVNGRPANGILVQPLRAVTPEFPLKCVVTPLGAADVRFVAAARSTGVGKPLAGLQVLPL